MPNHWIVVDTIRIPDALEQLQAITSVMAVKPLYAGSQFEYLIEQSPLLINLGDNDAVLTMWKDLPLFDSSSVIFAVEEQHEQALLAHLHNFMIVMVGQTELVFRFYTNSIWQQVAGSLEASDIDTLLGPASSLHWVDKQHQLQTLSHSPQSELPQSPYSLTSTVFQAWA